MVDRQAVCEEKYVSGPCARGLLISSSLFFHSLAALLFNRGLMTKQLPGEEEERERRETRTEYLSSRRFQDSVQPISLVPQGPISKMCSLPDELEYREVL